MNFIGCFAFDRFWSVTLLLFGLSSARACGFSSVKLGCILSCFDPDLVCLLHPRTPCLWYERETFRVQSIGACWLNVTTKRIGR